MSIVWNPSANATLVAPEIQTSTQTTTNSHGLFERVQVMKLAEDSENAKAVRFDGVVRNPDLTPARAIVFCLRIENSTATLAGRTVTNAQGRYLLSVAATESQRQQLCLYAVDSLDRFGWASDLNVNSDALHHCSIVLNENGGRIEGNLIGPSSMPMSGIKVKVQAFFGLSQHGNGCGVDFAPFEFESVPDENGHFVLTDLPNHMHALVAIDSDDWTCLNTIVGTSIETPCIKRSWGATTRYSSGSAQISVYPKTDLTGRVLDGSGDPISGVRIGPEATTDVEGNFTIRRLDPNATGANDLKAYKDVLQVQPPSDSRFSQQYVMLDLEQLSSKSIKPIVLEGAWVSGRVLSFKSKQPLAGIQVNAEKSLNSVQVTDGDGRFRVAFAPGQVAIRFAPKWMNFAEKNLYQSDPKNRAVRQIDVLDNQPVDLGTVLLDIDTQAAQPLTIRVVDSARQPVADCRVVLSQYRLADQRQIRLERVSLVRGDRIDQQILTDAHGIAVVKPAMGWSSSAQTRIVPQVQGQDTAENLVAVSYPAESPRYFGSLEIPKEVPAEVADVQLTEAAQYSGRVLLNGSPLVGAVVGLDARIPIGLAAANLNSDQLQATTNERGEYTIYAPAKQAYTVKLQHFPQRNMIIAPGILRLNNTDDPLKFVFADINLACGTRTISGTVVNADGQPIKNARITCKSDSKFLVCEPLNDTDENGRFLLTGLPEGSLTLEIRTGTQGRAKQFEIVEGQSEIKVELPR